jgi:hypothetical protein
MVSSASRDSELHSRLRSLNASWRPKRVHIAATIYQQLVAVNFCNARKKVQLDLFTVQVDREIVAAHFAKLQWGKTFCNGRKLFRGALCKSTMDEKRPKWPRTASRHTETPVQLSQIVRGDSMLRAAMRSLRPRAL